jgi:chemotaxis-related protein WspD
LVFRLGGEWLCLPARQCVTIAETAPAHRLPHRDSKLLTGVVAVKGRLYPCMSLAALMKIDAGNAPAAAGRRVYPRLLVMQLEQHEFALPVDELHGIHRYAEPDLRTPPATVNQTMNRYLTGVLDLGPLKVGCLDAELIGYQFAEALK